VEKNDKKKSGETEAGGKNVFSILGPVGESMDLGRKREIRRGEGGRVGRS